MHVTSLEYFFIGKNHQNVKHVQSLYMPSLHDVKGKNKRKGNKSAMTNS